MHPYALIPRFVVSLSPLTIPRIAVCIAIWPSFRFPPLEANEHAFARAPLSAATVY